jgi:hypothetical protein
VTIVSPRPINLRCALLASLASAIVFAPVLYRSAFNPDFHTSDFPIHLEIARRMAVSYSPQVPHFLYHYLLIAVSVLTGNYLAAGFGIVLAATAVTGAIIYHALSALDRKCWYWVAFAVAIMLAAPINFFSLPKNNLYLGYLAPNVYHNPTIILLKPFALAHFILISRLVLGNSQATKEWMLSAVLLVLGGLAKPIYLIMLLPLALVVPFVVRNGNATKIFIYILLPGAVVLTWQYLFTYVYQSAYYPKTSIAIIPFGAMRLRSQDLLPKLLASIAFPLVVAVLFWRSLKENSVVVFAWALFVIGSIYSYLFTETGEHMNHLNFVWCGELAVWLLFVVSVSLLWQLGRQGWRSFACWSIFGLHLAGGLLWYMMELNSPGKYW